MPSTDKRHRTSGDALLLLVAGFMLGYDVTFLLFSLGVLRVA